jgi:hypothetical protein
MNYVQILALAIKEAATIGAEIEVDRPMLEAGQDAQLSFTPQVGTVDGKPVYLVSHLTLTKPG